MAQLVFAGVLALVLLGASDAEAWGSGSKNRPSAAQARVQVLSEGNQAKEQVLSEKNQAQVLSDGNQVKETSSALVQSNGADLVQSNGADEVPPAPVPEPMTMLLLGSGAAGIVAWRKYRSK